MPNPLEYDEESEGSENELFGSESEYEQEDLIPDKRKPIKAVKAGPSTGDSLPPANRHPATPTPQAPPRLTPEQRLEQIRQKHACLDRPPSSGSPTLKWLTMRLILMNSTRIDDIGGLTYKQMAVLLDQLPRTALQVVEENCPHILKETDWLWEGFLIQDYALYYERVRETKSGMPRTKGWRAKYAEAMDEAETRKQKAAARISKGYAAMEKERQDRKIKVIDSFIAAPKGSRGHSFRTARTGKAAASSYQPLKKAQTAINKARNDSQRARVALTHASGKFIPPPQSMSPAASSSSSHGPYHNPWVAAESHSTHTSNPRHPNYIRPDQMVSGSRIPPPRIPKPLVQPTEKAKAKAPEPVTPFPGARPTEPAARVALPAHIKPSPPVATERFRIDDNAPKTRAIPKPNVSNFVPESSKPKLDFFARPGSSSTKRAAPQVGQGDVKRPRVELAEASASPPASPPVSRFPPRKPPRPMADILFQKKQPHPSTARPRP